MRKYLIITATAFVWAMSGMAVGLCAQETADPVVAAGRYPPADRAWSLDDYRAFAQMIRFSKAGAMPSLATPPLMLHFVRLVDPANVAAITATGAPPEVKQEYVLGILTATGIVRARYSTQIRLGAPLAGELKDIQIFQLHLLAVAAELSATAAEEVARDQGIDLAALWQTTIYKSMRTAYLGIVESLTEPDIYDAGQRAELAMALAEAWPAVKTILTAADRPQLVALLREGRERAGNPETERAIDALAAAVAAD